MYNKIIQMKTAPVDPLNGALVHPNLILNPEKIKKIIIIIICWKILHKIPR